MLVGMGKIEIKSQYEILKKRIIKATQLIP